jgi:hypothetical protein
MAHCGKADTDGVLGVGNKNNVAASTVAVVAASGGDTSSHGVGGAGASSGSSSSEASSASGGTPSCDPPNTELVGDHCVPSCGVAGGNTCTDANTTLCDGLPILPAYDCPVCCARPPSPPIGPASFHIVHQDFPDAWDSILALSNANPYALIASQNRPPSVPSSQWAQNITTTYGVKDGVTVSFAGGEDMAAFIHAVLQKGVDGPMRVMIDELRSDTKDAIYACAATMASKYPQWTGRWGVYLVHGNNVGYPNLNTDPTPAIDALLNAGATIAAELYAKRSEYCAAGGTAALRDAWLASFYRGGEGAFPQGRFRWLAERKAALGSTSQLSMLFGVTDTYMTGVGPAVFLDRMFYVWRAKSGYPSLLLPGNGGPGAWKWQDQSPTSRDAAFAESFDHYVVQGQAASLKGQVACP